jgi:cytochrome c
LTRQFRPQIIAALVAALVLLISGWNLAVSAQAQAHSDGKAHSINVEAGATRQIAIKEGPPLGGVFGRTAGAIDSFQYSDALKKSGIKWTDENLDKWLADTEKLVPNYDMTFHIEKAEERREIIALPENTALNSSGSLQRGNRGDKTRRSTREKTWDLRK